MAHNALRSWHATMYKFVTSMVRCGLGMQQCAMHNATIQKTTFFELGVYSDVGLLYCSRFYIFCPAFAKLANSAFRALRLAT